MVNAKRCPTGRRQGQGVTIITGITGKGTTVTVRIITVRITVTKITITIGLTVTIYPHY
jgi:hypothetical protein